MRTIKFRGWDLVNMVDDVCIVEGKYWFKEKGGERGTYWDFETYPVMQFTGLKDCKGVEIYEGDIIDAHPDGGVYPTKTGRGSVCQVVYYIGKLDFRDGDIEIDYCGFVRTWDFEAIDSECEVIGNIYENEDLLDYSQK